MFLDKEKISLVLSNDVPQTSEILKDLRLVLESHLEEKKLTPPLLEEDVLIYSKSFISKYPEFSDYQKLTAVLINNFAWKKVFSDIPFNKRILLLPRCMHHSSKCIALSDEIGLLCRHCNHCDLSEIISYAESLGYHTIVSEGVTAVKSLLSSGELEAVVGVGCLDSLQRSFPLTVKEAIPSQAIPLYNSDCKNSKVNINWLKDVISQQSVNSSQDKNNFKHIKDEVNSWFTQSEIEKLFSLDDQSIEIANQWIANGGKRWRPIILAAVYNALKQDNISSNTIRKLTTSVECFHKASLAHDDIEDSDPGRYGNPSLHHIYDIPVALNTGDLLIAYGYQMIAESDITPIQMKKILQIASCGHRDLCLGQGQELLWRSSNKILSVQDVLKIFRYKTAPAFEVSLKIGAIIGDASVNVMSVLEQYSKSIGIAYQIKDDIADFKEENITSDYFTLGPSLITSLLAEKLPNEVAQLLNDIKTGKNLASNQLITLAKKHLMIKKAEELCGLYQQKTLESIRGLEEAELKMLLHRLANKILN